LAGGAGALPGLIAGRSRLEVPTGFSGFSLFDLGGKRKWSYRRGRDNGSALAELPAGLAEQTLLVRWETAKPR
jgi:hypothetical protein